MPSPLTESLLVHWRPTVHFHLHRLEPLAELENDGLLQHFLVTPERLGLRTETTQLTMEEGEIALHPRGSLVADETLHVLRSAIRCAAPLEYDCAVTFQFVVPVNDQSYDEARASALARMSVGALGGSDFSMMLEGKVADDVWHCEFGIVSEPEVELRLRRWVGRAGQMIGQLPPFVAIPDEVAAVSLFADLVWQVPTLGGRGADSAQDIAEKVNWLRVEADRIVSLIYERLCHTSLEPIVKAVET